jgi:hypothetical protein
MKARDLSFSNFDGTSRVSSRKTNLVEMVDDHGYQAGVDDGLDLVHVPSGDVGQEPDRFL